MTKEKLESTDDQQWDGTDIEPGAYVRNTEQSVGHEIDEDYIRSYREGDRGS